MSFQSNVKECIHDVWSLKIMLHKKIMVQCEVQNQLFLWSTVIPKLKLASLGINRDSDISVMHIDYMHVSYQCVAGASQGCCYFSSINCAGLCEVYASKEACCNNLGISFRDFSSDQCSVW